MKSFNKLSGIVASLPQVNIDTDAIIPKQFLKTIERTGLGKHLFHEKRYDKENNLNESFVLNKEPWNKSNIIVAGDNFGCGSSSTLISFLHRLLSRIYLSFTILWHPHSS